MTYLYDRTSSEKTWYDVQIDAETEYITDVAKALAKELDGTSKVGGFGSATVIFNGQTLTMGFKGGGGGTVYVMAPGKKSQIEHSVVNHTPRSFAVFLVNTMKLKA